MTGPPTTPPKSFCCTTPRALAAASRNQSLASNTVLRKYSKTSPWNAFVPERLTREICPPGERPNSGAKLDVEMRNSWRASTDTMLLKPPVDELVGVEPVPFELIEPPIGAPALALTPSSVKYLVSVR